MLKALLTLALITTPSSGLDRDGLPVDNLRFLDDQGKLTFAADAPLPARTPGLLKMELRFEVHSRNDRGLFASTPLRVAWAPEAGPWVELGLMPAGPFARVDALTGAAVATLALPLRLDQDQALPLLAVGRTTLRLAVAPIDQSLLDGRGEPAAAATVAILDLHAWLPEVWVGSPFYGDGQLLGAEADYFLRTREPAASTRFFALQAHPPGGITLSTDRLVLEPGQDSIGFQVSGSTNGSFQLTVTEFGQEVARSDVRRIERALAVMPLVDLGEQEIGDAVLAVMAAKQLLKRCVPAMVFGGGPGNVQSCQKCDKSGAKRPCREEGGTPVGIAFPGDCAFGFDECYMYAAVREAGKYTYASKELIECGEALMAPFGSGVILKFYRTCCTYAPAEGKGNIVVMDCY